MTKEGLLLRLAPIRDAQFAELVTLTLGIVAETHPELLREALAKVFDLSAVEIQARNAARVLIQCQQKAHNALMVVNSLIRKVERLEKRIDYLESRAS